MKGKDVKVGTWTVKVLVDVEAMTEEAARDYVAGVVSAPGVAVREIRVEAVR